uniref:DUF4129 domain-containing protein n=1 Tax=Candidatus Methanophagaceae archaeon ANME-1 ERB6 TaxID=2759912 RepID=A0A7G9Z103_9EURY|nr:hypothetical protein NNHBGCAA_00037 [Methanosarcinales archaeon ANME-1 ERB6]
MQTRAMAEKRKRKITVLTLLILVLMFLSPASAGGVRHQIYSEASSSDEGIHSFFSDILEEAGNCMDKFLEESPDADKFASSLESEIKLTEEESRFYAAKGIESNVSSVLSPFCSLSGGIKKITLFQVVFLTNYETLKNESDYEAYVRARIAVVKMRTGADGINCSLDGIEPIELWNETSILLFNVSELRDKLKDVYALIDHYEKLLEKYEIEAPAFEEYLLVVVVTDEHPFLYEEIMIYVYARNVTSLSLVIGNATYELKNQTEQTKRYSFEEPGEYEIYAEAITSDGKIIKSNIVKVYVSKIPTFIVLSSKYAALVNEDVKIAGLLVDYYNEPLHGANVTVKAGDEETELTTDRSENFVFDGTRSSEGVLNVSAFYPGNNTYKSSSANISIFFSRFPVSLHIEADETHINVNETANFTGYVYGVNPNYTVPLIIFVNDTRVKTLTAEKDFNFSLFFSSPGTYEVYAFFPGDSLFKPAKSNVVKITVTKKAEVLGDKRGEEIINIYREFDILFYLLLILVAIVSFFVGLHARTLKRKLHASGERLHILRSKLHVFKEKILTPMASLFASLYTRTLKDKIHTLRGKMHVFIEKTFAPIASILTVIYARVFKGKFHAFSKSKNKLRALMQKKRTEQNKTIENLRIDVAEEEVEKEKERYEEVSEVNILEGVDLEGAYKLLFDTIVDKYSFKKNLTPRELLETIKKKKEPFTEMLEGVTEIYEKAVYGNIEPMDGEEESYFKRIEEILRYFKG